MNKKLLIPVVLLGVLLVGLQLVNHQATKAIKTQIAEVNQSYAEMAEQGLLPALQLQYQSVHASVLRSRYRIEGISLQLQGLGELLTIEQVQLNGIKPNRLSDQGSVRVRSLALGGGAKLFVPAELSDFAASLKVHGDYSYQYQASNGLLELAQQTRINDEFVLRYHIQFAEMQAVWQELSNITAMSSAQQQAMMDSDVYVEQFTAAVMTAALSGGEIRIENHGFLQRLLALTAAQGQTPDFSVLQGMALMMLSTAEALPAEIRQKLIVFVQQPESLTLFFQLQQPLRLAELEQGAAFQTLESLDDLLEFAGVRVSVND
ncbi:hypothetical protein [Alkalimonas amylolytica]|uniref:DUF945 domain-containing protein n=1 Tax=Alkalimonas amylolytica TaxID=152573 RepID=A0A1H4DJV7_ALKAM|nr:hypothetical protein [Alkalimonas amylolytica]SEA72769.1 hypothetical protein SAMN04488051_105284 [Alkalimonas amylolytica]